MVVLRPPRRNIERDEKSNTSDPLVKPQSISDLFKASSWSHARFCFLVFVSTVLGPETNLWKNACGTVRRRFRCKVSAEVGSEDTDPSPRGCGTLALPNFPSLCEVACPNSSGGMEDNATPPSSSRTVGACWQLDSALLYFFQ